jgi:glutamate-5-semialdehyde dehydrogenase
MMAQDNNVALMGGQAKKAARLLALACTEEKNSALQSMADEIEKQKEAILTANAEDIAAARRANLQEVLVERLTLNPKRVSEMAAGLRAVAALPDPVGEVIEETRRPNGILIKRIRVPLGVIGIIYESRPNVTADAAGLCLKSGNAVILRGGSEAIRSNVAIVRALTRPLGQGNVPKECIQLVETTDRESVNAMLRLRASIDAIIPRGGAGLIQAVVENSNVPVIETGIGNCHVYVDADADLKMAEEVVFNAKVQRPGVCNAAEKLLVHRSIARTFLPVVAARLQNAGVELRGDDESRAIVPSIKPASEEDWATEYLALIMGIKVVGSVTEATAHINKYGSMHSESIVTGNPANAEKFLREVDAAAVYHNASTRFTDGGEFGMGAEIGISTQKLHARGPMGLRELTSTKFVVFGSGQVRQ